MPSLDALEAEIRHAQERIGIHDGRHSTAIGALRVDVDDLKLWRARLQGQLAAWAAAGALAGGLLSQLPALLKWLAGHP